MICRAPEHHAVNVLQMFERRLDRDDAAVDDDPYVLARVEHALYGTSLQQRADVLERLAPYVAAQIRSGEAVHHIARHVLGLFLGEPGARAFRRYLSEHMRASGADFGVLRGALAALQVHAQARAA